jgi:hypothetical protein
MKRKIRDRHLDVPAEANRDKHINFVAAERNETDPADDNRAGKLSSDYRSGKEEKKKRKK